MENSVGPERLSVSAPLVTPVVLLLNDTTDMEIVLHTSMRK